MHQRKPWSVCQLGSGTPGTIASSSGTVHPQAAACPQNSLHRTSAPATLITRSVGFRPRRVLKAMSGAARQTMCCALADRGSLAARPRHFAAVAHPRAAKRESRGFDCCTAPSGPHTPQTRSLRGAQAMKPSEGQCGRWLGHAAVRGSADAFRSPECWFRHGLSANVKSFLGHYSCSTGARTATAARPSYKVIIRAAVRSTGQFTVQRPAPAAGRLQCRRSRRD